MRLSYAEPTGERRNYSPDRVFFSTTDRRGVIETVNGTFVELAQFSEEELIGSPHSITRHPDMPGAAFHIWWERLLAGKSMMAYVKNLAHDGSEYLTFSTVTPLGEGFISVRSAVTRQDLWEPIWAAYTQTRAFERSLRAQGESSAGAAARGAVDLTSRLAAMGFPTYDDVIHALVPAEVDERRRLAPPRTPQTRPGEPLHEVVSAIIGLDGELMRLRARYENAGEVAQALEVARVRLAVTLDALAESAIQAADAAATVADKAPIANKAAQAALGLAGQAATDMAPLSESLARVRWSVLELRSMLALSVLHNDMAMIFAGEAAQTGGRADTSHTVLALGQTVAHSVAAGEGLRREVSAGLTSISAAIEGAHETLLAFQRMLTNWRHVVVRAGVSQELGPLVDPIDRRLASGMQEMRELTALGRQCRTLADSIDTSALQGAADRLVGTAAAL